MSMKPRDIVGDIEPGFTVIAGWQDAVDKVKALIVQKLKAYYQACPDSEEVQNWHDVRALVLASVGAAAKAKLEAANPRVFNEAFDQLVAEGILVYRPPKQPAETAPDVD